MYGNCKKCLLTFIKLFKVKAIVNNFNCIAFNENLQTSRQISMEYTWMNELIKVNCCSNSPIAKAPKPRYRPIYYNILWQ